jgi:hypothetical protein
MKKLILAACAICMLFGAVAQQQQLKTPPASPTQTVKQDFALSSMELSYSRPGVKGRKVFGDLVPYGKVWRTGANAATTITFGDDVIIGGKKIPAGKYGLVTIPEKDSWTLIISKQLDLNNPSNYKQENDIVRVTAKPMEMKDKMETFTMQFADITPNSCALHIMWENTAVALPITSDVDGKVMKNIDDMMKADTKPYFAAAVYYLQNGKDLNQALAWFDKAIELESNPNAYWMHHQRANCLAKLGRKKEARDAAEKSKAMAVTAKNDDYVKLNNNLLATL